jgi:hypothetical protein
MGNYEKEIFTYMKYAEIPILNTLKVDKAMNKICYNNTSTYPNQMPHK